MMFAACSMCGNRSLIDAAFASDLRDEWLRPAKFGDVLVTIGSGNKLHAMQLTDATRGRGLVTARCGPRGRKIGQPTLNTEPPNTARWHEICMDCRAHCRGVRL